MNLFQKESMHAQIEASKNYAHYIEYLKTFHFIQSDLSNDEFRAM